MNVDDLVNSYVSDVVKRLPRRQRVDVALELRSLLADELASDDGSTPTPERAQQFLRGFGRPADVAARYRPAMTVIDPSDARVFLRSSVIGVVVIWVLGVLASAQQVGSLGGAEVARHWWVGYGLPALWWPGFLVVAFSGAAWARRRWPQVGQWKPRPHDDDHVSRIGYAAATVGAAAGTIVLLAPNLMLDVAFAGKAAPQAYAAFAYDTGFTRLLGPTVLVALVAHVGLLATLTGRGRWEPITRRIGLGLTIVTCVLMAWIAFGGPVFQVRPTDQTARLAVLIVLVVELISLVRKRYSGRIRSLLAARPHSTLSV